MGTLIMGGTMLPVLMTSRQGYGMKPGVRELNTIYLQNNLLRIVRTVCVSSWIHKLIISAKL